MLQICSQCAQTQQGLVSFFPLEAIDTTVSCSILVRLFCRPDINCHPGSSLPCPRIPLTSLCWLSSFLMLWIAPKVYSLIAIQYLSSHALWARGRGGYMFLRLWRSDSTFTWSLYTSLIARRGIEFYVGSHFLPELRRFHCLLASRWARSCYWEAWCHSDYQYFVYDLFWSLPLFLA